ncbi:hypothetical protein [Liberiplasma polymorphum]|uniref:hypothetical protein n=1 Tax=Liberiplasma polymorphum TaxID=3374570 RepID=UPI003771A266
MSERLDTLFKVREMIIEQQRNSDSKAHIFIIFLSAIILLMYETPIITNDANIITTLKILLIMLVIPLFLFVLTLIPIYSQENKQINKIKKFNIIDAELNIHYWRSIQRFPNFITFREKFETKYNASDLSKIEIDLLEQIYINSKIMERKSYTHKLAFYILGILVSIFIVGLFVSLLKITNNWIILFFLFIALSTMNGYLFRINSLFNNAMKVFNFMIRRKS